MIQEFHESTGRMHGFLNNIPENPPASRKDKKLVDFLGRDLSWENLRPVYLEFRMDSDPLEADDPKLEKHVFPNLLRVAKDAYNNGRFGPIYTRKTVLEFHHLLVGTLIFYAYSL